MKTRTLLIVSAAGLVLGALAGFVARPAVTAAPATPPAKSPARDSANAAHRGPDFPDDDERIVQLFSALQEPLALRKRHALFGALRDLTADDLPALVQRVEAMPAEIRDDLLHELVGRWFEIDLNAARAWMLAHPRESLEIGAWVKADPEGAIRDALALPKDQWRARMLLNLAIDETAGPSAAAKLAKLRTLPAGALRDGVVAGVLAKWAGEEPAAAWASLDELPPGREREQARDGVLRKWAEREPVGALVQMDAILPTLKAGVLGNELVTAIAGTVAEKDPRLALDWLGGIPVEFRTAPAIAAAAVWAQKEPVAALDWCVANGVDVARGKRLDFGSWHAGVLAEAMGKDPAATIAWIEPQPAGRERDRLLERAVADSMWWRADTKILSPDSDLVMRLFREMPEDSQIRSATTLSQRRAQQDELRDLNAWAQNFPPGSVRAEAVASTIGAVFRRDASRVDPLLAGVAGVDRDAALRGLANAMSDTAPAAAATRALGIADAPLRRETLDSVMSTWLQRDPEASRAWLQDAPDIPATWKQAWLRPK